jgi:eukaryotic-like serine/threonine-protein kinase
MQEFRKFPKKSENALRVRLFEFGPFRLNPQKRIVLRDNEPIPLTPKCFDLLLALVEHSGEVLVKEELMDTVWQGTAVEEGNLNRHISTLRKVLGESPNDHRYIVTVPGRGYRFVADVRKTPEESAVRPWPEARATFSESVEPLPDAPAHRPALHSVAAPSSVVLPRSAPRFLNWSPTTFLLLALVIALGALGAVFLKSRWKPNPTLTENDQILIADFSNTTGDSVFDDTLKQAVSVQLSQSPYLNILSDAKVHSILNLMTKPPATPLSADVAREVCQRAGAKAYIAGSIASLGAQYVIGLNAVDCRSGDSLAREQVVAPSKEQVLNALGGATASLRGKLGESLSTVREFDTPLVDATTPSLDALKSYSLGLQKDEVNDADAIPFFKRAIQLDPDFASAYSALAVCYRNLGESGLARENFSKAFELRDHVSEREKLLISARYYDHVTGELQKAIENYQLWIQAYPRDANAHSNLASLYGASGQFDKSIEETRQAISLDPESGTNYSNLILAQASLDRFDDATKTFHLAMDRKIDDPIARVNWFGVAFVLGNASEMDKQMAWSAGKPEGEDNFFAAKSDAEAYVGRDRSARDFSEKAFGSAMRNDEKEAAAQWKMDEAVREAEFGYRDAAQKLTSAALALTPSHDTRILAGIALARAGNSAEAEKIANDLEKRYPLDTLVLSYWLPVIRAGIELDRQNPQRAILLLQPAAPFEQASPNTWSGLGGPMYPAFLRGESFLQMRRGADAAAEYQKILDHRGFMLACPLGALAHLGMARAYRLQGDVAKSRSAYQVFFTLWKDADPDIPILVHARAEFAALHSAPHFPAK